MKKITVTDLMEELRNDGWCVVLKCLPKEIGWLIEGARSEYDAPCEDRHVGHGKWLCEASWVIPNGKWRHSQSAMDEDPLDAVKKVFFQVRCDDDRLRASDGMIKEPSL